MRTLCDSPRVRGLVSFYGAFYSAENDTINIALEYVEGGSLEALLKRGGAIPCDVLGAHHERRDARVGVPAQRPEGRAQRRQGAFRSKIRGSPRDGVRASILEDWTFSPGVFCVSPPRVPRFRSRHAATPAFQLRLTPFDSTPTFVASSPETC